MDNQIKSSLLNTDSMKNILNDVQINAINLNFDDIPIDTEKQIANRNKEKAKELIQKLLNESLEQRIFNSEKRTRNQLVTIKNTKKVFLPIN